MNIEKLEKLAELKKTGILTQEEYEEEKKILLSGQKESLPKEVKEKINWKNIGLSFIYVLMLYFVLIGVAGLLIEKNTALEKGLLVAIPVTIFAGLAYKFETVKYKNGSGVIGSMIGVFVLGPIAAWVFTYHILQIKDGLRSLISDKINNKEQKGKKSVIRTIFWILGIMAALGMIAALFVGAKSGYDLAKKRIEEEQFYKCENVQIQQKEVIPLLNQSVASFGIHALSIYNIKEVKYDHQNGSRTCHAIADFSDGEKALIEFAFISDNRKDYKIGIRIINVIE